MINANGNSNVSYRNLFPPDANDLALYYKDTEDTITISWAESMLSSYIDINDHNEFTDLQKFNILNRLSEPYVVNTFGPDGLNKTVCDFFIYLENTNTTTAIGNGSPLTTKTGDLLRWNYGNGIYTQNNLPTEINNGIITMTSTDGFAGITYFKMYFETMAGFLPNFDTLMPNLKTLVVAGNAFTGNIYPFTSAVINNISMSENSLYGTLPDLTPLVKLILMAVNLNPDLEGDFNYTSNITTNIDVSGTKINNISAIPLCRSVKIYKFSSCRIPSTVLSSFLSRLNTFYSALPPLRSGTFNFDGPLNGFIADDNPDLLNLQTIFTNEGYVFTITYNSASALSSGMIALTFDDVPLTVHDVGLPLLTSKGVAGTVYQCNEYIDQYSSVYEESFCGWDELKDFEAAGWSVGSHAYNHDHLADDDEATIRASFANSIAEFVTNGLASPTHFAYPYGSYDALTTAIAPDYFETARIAAPDKSITKTTNTALYPALTIDGYTEEDNWIELKEYIDFAAANNVGFIFLTHSVYDTYVQTRSISSVFLAKIIDYIKTTTAQLVTIDELYTETQS